jgi:hypothetical protein
LAANCGVAQGMSTSGGGLCLLLLNQAVETVKHFFFPPLLVPEVSPATIRSSTGSGFFGSSTPTSSSFVGVGAELAHPFFPSPSPIVLGEKIRSSLPMLQNSKPYQCYYRKARVLRGGHSMRWNEVLLAESLAASKSPASFSKKESVVAPPLKNYVVHAKDFLRTGFSTRVQLH